MRLFVALEIPEDVRAALRAFVQPLRTSWPRIRWTRPEGQHVTLKFLGEVGEERLETVVSMLVPLRTPEPIAMNFRGIGFFPQSRRARVLWAGVEESSNLQPLAAEVEGALVAAGFPAEQRAFRPHLTLARFGPQEDTTGLQAALAPHADAAFGSATAWRFILFRSHLKPGGAEYTPLETFPFVEGKF
jgi:2'-5' RNA ligase